MPLNAISGNPAKDVKYVKWNMNNLESIKKAERRKAKLENQGYNRRHSFVNQMSGECSLTYEK